MLLITKYSSIENIKNKAELKIGSKVFRPISSLTANQKAILQIGASKKIEDIQRLSHIPAGVKHHQKDVNR